MWSRAELKKKGQQTFNRNYWKCVLVALIMALVTGGSGGSNGFNNASSAAPSALVGSATEDASEFSEEVEEFNADMDEMANDIAKAQEDLKNVNVNIEGVQFPKNLPNAGKVFAGVLVGIAAVVAFLVVFAIIFAIDAFIFNPLELGCDRFFYKNLDEPAEVAEIAYGFDHGYKNVVKVMFFRDLYTLLWSLLFIIPGIVKAYEYRMIPYILADNPDMDKDEAFARSREMMTGQKWKTFVLDLSFIGWNILSLLTIGLLGIFYVGPYKRATRAALYDTLKNDGIDVTEVIEDAADEIVSGEF